MYLSGTYDTINEVRISVDDLEDYLDMAKKDKFVIVCSCPDQHFQVVSETISNHENNRNVFESWGQKEDSSSGMMRDKSMSCLHAPVSDGVVQGEEDMVNTFDNQKGKYTGDFVGGKAHGKGTWVGEKGDKYVGDWKDDKKHGQGTCTYANGDKYEGEWDGKEHAQGTFTYADGRKYEGKWKNGKIRTQRKKRRIE